MNSWVQLALVLLHLSAAALAIGHALLHKRISQSALGWIATCILFPLAGPVLYFFFGINRVRDRAKKLRQQAPQKSRPTSVTSLKNFAPPDEFSELTAFFSTVTGEPLLPGNHIEILLNGEQAYPAMLQTIAEATRCVYLSTYIFRGDHSGQLFIEALAAAHGRGVDVRVLVDGYGDLYYFPRASARLKKRGIKVQHFLPLRLIPPSAYINLRNHRKILAVDGYIAFTGGINIGDHHLADDTANPQRVTDTHFRLTGPVVTQLEAVFLNDWSFATGNTINPTPIEHTPQGTAICRTITDGPDDNVDKIALSLVSAAASARRSISIMTPYFLPPRELIGALQAAALRGIDVSIILPAKNNLFFVHRAARNLLWELLQYGVKMYYQPPPFAHGKLFIVDEHYAQIGSANIDPRSLRLNFEIAVEICGDEFVQRLSAHFNKLRQQSAPITLAEVNGRPLHTRLIDAAFWLFSPYM